MFAGSIQGVVWNDYDQDGARDGNEPTLAGWTVYLDADHDGRLDGGERSTVSGSDGSYAFANLAAGNYLIGLVPKPGWTQTAPPVPAAGPLAGAALSGGSGDGLTDAMIGAIERAKSYDPAELAARPTWLVAVRPGTKIDAVVRATGASAATPTGSLPNVYALKFAPDVTGAQAAARLAGAGGLSYYYPLLKRQQQGRLIPNDTLFGQQWHLRNTGQYGGVSGNDLNVTPVWDNYQGNNVVVAVVDDGLQYDHPDLSQNYDSSNSTDIYGDGGDDDDDDDDGDNDPAPGPGDDHGTAVAGVLGARGNNGRGVSGVAPRVKLAGIRLTSGDTDDLMEAAALSFNRQSIAVYSNSWGPSDDGTDLDGPGPGTLDALRDGVTVGRGGRGNVFVWAAGNGLADNDNVNYDGYANSRYVIAATAVDHRGRQADYAEPGAPILVSAYAGGSTPGVTTTDRTGGAGWDPANYFDDFGGTSAAAPMVSGVVALMLQANPTLTWRDVKHVLVNSARKNDAADAGWVRNGAGRWVNHKYGFGAVDAAAAVQAALAWDRVLPEQVATSGPINVGLQIPDDDTGGIVSSVTIGQLMRVETVEVVFDATHPYRGDLRVVLVSPDGTESVLAEPHEDFHADYDRWTFTTNRHWDEVAKGTWRLRVTDEGGGDVGTLNSWKLNLYGTPVVGQHYVAVGADATVGGQDFGVRALPGARVTAATFPFQTGPHRVVVTFDQDVAGSVSVDDLEVWNTTIGAAVPTAAMQLAYTPANRTAVWTFPGLTRGLLADGDYTARLKAAQVTLAGGAMLDGNGDGVGGDDFVSTFFHLRGDANRDRVVDAADLKVLVQNVGRSSDAVWGQADFDYDGRVDFLDFQTLELSFGRTLSAPAAAMTTTPFAREAVAPVWEAAAPTPVLVNGAAGRPKAAVAPTPVFATRPIVRRR